jgi:hypothetical protein
LCNDGGIWSVRIIHDGDFVTDVGPMGDPDRIFIINPGDDMSRIPMLGLRFAGLRDAETRVASRKHLNVSFSTFNSLAFNKRETECGRICSPFRDGYTNSEGRRLAGIGNIENINEVTGREWIHVYRNGPANPRALLVAQPIQLPLQGGGAFSGFVPSIESKYYEKESEKSDEIMRNSMWVLYRHADQLEKPAQWSDDVSAIPAIMIIGAAVCMIIGFGFIIVGSHVIGICLFIFGVVLGIVPYNLSGGRPGLPDGVQICRTIKGDTRCD